MAFFTWSDELSIGSRFIDDDHRKLIKLVNDLYGAMEQGRGKDLLGKVLDELIAYTKEHFGREEEVMKRIAYADAAAHKAQHDTLIREVVELRRKFVEGQGMLTLTVSKFLRDWLMTHIMQSDKKLAGAIKAAGLQGH